MFFSSSYRVLKSILPHEFRQSLKRKIFHVNDMKSRLANLKRAGFHCTGAIDGGAFEGDWTRLFWSAFPDIPCVLVEPLPEKQRALAEVAARVPESLHVSAALGKEPGIARFRTRETNSGVVMEEVESGRMDLLTVEMTTLDVILEQTRTFQPNLLKLDLQGFEMECMKGCRDLATRFEVIILEMSILPIGSVPSFRDVNRFLEEAGFRLYDILPQYYRPLDGALWQCDAFYVREGSALIQSLEWA